MKLLIAIGTGSFIGGVSRYLLSQYIQTKFLSAFPYGTLAVNVIGSLLIGVVFGLFDKGNFSIEWRLFLATGLLGGFTTFSAFSIETISLLRDGQIWYAAAYICSTIIIGIFAAFAGISITKLF